MLVVINRLMIYRDDFLAPAHVDLCLCCPTLKYFLEVVLLQVDHRRAFVAGFSEQIEVIDLIVSKERSPAVPANTALRHIIAHV
jgi:hypothetical protein